MFNSATNDFLAKHIARLAESVLNVYQCHEWLQLGVWAALRSFLVDLFVPKIKLRERERVNDFLAKHIARLAESVQPFFGTLCQQELGKQRHWLNAAQVFYS
jgi:hypothetical protein